MSGLVRLAGAGLSAVYSTAKDGLICTYKEPKRAWKNVVAGGVCITAGTVHNVSWTLAAVCLGDIVSQGVGNNSCPVVQTGTRNITALVFGDPEAMGQLDPRLVVGMGAAAVAVVASRIANCAYNTIEIKTSSEKKNQGDGDVLTHLEESSRSSSRASSEDGNNNSEIAGEGKQVALDSLQAGVLSTTVLGGQGSNSSTNLLQINPSNRGNVISAAKDDQGNHFGDDMVPGTPPPVVSALQDTSHPSDSEQE